MPTAVKTQNVPRRKLRFDTIDDVLADLDRIEVAQQAGHLRVTGNWTPGQILNHLALWILYAYEGFPMKAPPWLFRPLLRMFFRRAIRKGLKPGLHIHGAPGGTYGIEDAPFDAALARYRTALSRLRSEPAKFESPGAGPLSDDDRRKLNLRHAELHLSFLCVDA